MSENSGICVWLKKKKKMRFRREVVLDKVEISDKALKFAEINGERRPVNRTDRKFPNDSKLPPEKVNFRVVMGGGMDEEEGGDYP